MLAVPLTSEKGCLGNMVNSMLRHICGHIYDIIRHIVVSSCQALRCAARSAFSAVGQLIEELEKLNVPAPGNV